jgi:hypothetical protein
VRKAAVRCRRGVCTIDILRPVGGRLVNEVVSRVGRGALFVRVAAFFSPQQIDLGHAATAFLEDRPASRQVCAKHIAGIGGRRHFYPVPGQRQAGPNPLHLVRCERLLRLHDATER